MRYNYKYKNEAGEYAPMTLKHNGHLYINPPATIYEEAGYSPIPEPTEEELAIAEREREIQKLKDQLALTDYIALKAIEGYDCDELYPNWREERKALRDKINELEDLNNG